jgi:hypothetical protein
MTGENDIVGHPAGWKIYAAAFKGLKRFPNLRTQSKKERYELNGRRV